jgi:hypothetical protein
MPVSAVAASPVVILLSGATKGGGPLVRVSGGKRVHPSVAGGCAVAGRGAAWGTGGDVGAVSFSRR